MHQEFVFPQNNEEEFITIAERLKIPAVCFVYPTINIVKKEYDTKIKISYGVLLTDITKAKIAKEKFDFVLSNLKNPSVFDSKNIDIVFGQEFSEQNDKLQYRESGLNQVFCEKMHANEISYGIEISRLINDEQNRVKYLGRMMQNIRLCNKYGVKIILSSFAKIPYEMRRASDLDAFFRLLNVK